MDDLFKIYVHRLTEGRKERIEERIDPTFMDVAESELSFTSPVLVKGEAFLATDTLILRLRVETETVMPCAICNKDVRIKILIPNFCHTEELSGIKGGIFDYSGILREAVLLELPMTAECENSCPERETISVFLSSRKHKGEEYRPFEDL